MSSIPKALKSATAASTSLQLSHRKVNTLIILLGPTAVGKTELSLRLADRFHSPILSCDSRQLYRDLPIGTAAPTADQLARAKHYFIGTLGLEDYYSAAQYEQDALAVLQEEFRQHDTLVMTGGSMMYIDAVCQGIPFIERLTTVTGDCIKEPKNLRLRIGTTFQEAIDYCGGFSKQPDRLIAGGPMMGLAQYQLDVPITKGASGILALSPEKCQVGEESPCIRCGRCVEACPMGLIPSQLSIFSSCQAWDKCMEYGVMNCVECGSCVYTCPAKRNIVQYIRNAKGQCKAIQRAAQAKAEAQKAKN